MLTLNQMMLTYAMILVRLITIMSRNTMSMYATIFAYVMTMPTCVRMHITATMYMMSMPTVPHATTLTNVFMILMYTVTNVPVMANSYH